MPDQQTAEIPRQSLNPPPKTKKKVTRMRDRGKKRMKTKSIASCNLKAVSHFVFFTSLSKENLGSFPKTISSQASDKSLKILSLSPMYWIFNSDDQRVSQNRDNESDILD